MYSQMREFNEHSRNYRLWIPGGERCLHHKNYYSGYVFFSGLTLLSGYTLPRLEEYTSELQNRALDLLSSLDTLYQVIYQRLKYNLEAPYTDLVPYFCDFDKFWLLYEKRLYTCYHNVFHINKIKSTQMVKVFQKFMIKTLVYSVRKNYFTLDMAYEYDPLIMISLPRLTFVYVIYHLCNPFFFSNFPWFSKERYADIDKINQTFNLLNRKSVEKLELYLIQGIPSSNTLKRKGSSSSRKSGKRSSMISNASGKSERLSRDSTNGITNDNRDSNDAYHDGIGQKAHRNSTSSSIIIENTNGENKSEDINGCQEHQNDINSIKHRNSDKKVKILDDENRYFSEPLEDCSAILIRNGQDPTMPQPKSIANIPSPSSINEKSNPSPPHNDSFTSNKHTNENSENDEKDTKDNNNNNNSNSNSNKTKNSYNNNNNNNNNSSNNNSTTTKDNKINSDKPENKKENISIKVDHLINNYVEEEIHSSSSTPSPDILIDSGDSKLLLHSNETTTLESEEKTLKTEVDEWYEEEEEEEDKEDCSSTASSSSSSEDEIIGDILVRKVFKSVCAIVDEFQSNEVAKLLNGIMKSVFVKGIEKLERLQELEEEKKAKAKAVSSTVNGMDESGNSSSNNTTETHQNSSSLRTTTTSKKLIQSKILLSKSC